MSDNGVHNIASPGSIAAVALVDLLLRLSTLRVVRKTHRDGKTHFAFDPSPRDRHSSLWCRFERFLMCRLDNLLATSSLSGIKSSGHGAGAGVGGRRDARLVSNLWACGFELLHFGSRTAEDRIALPDTDLSYQGMRNLELEMQRWEPLGIAFDLHAVDRR